jgi:hypothetical protein
LAFPKKSNKDYFLFYLSKDCKDFIQIYRPSEIIGYFRNQKNFISHHAGKAYFFIEQIEMNTIELYERITVPYDRSFLYYVELKNSPNYFVVDPFTGNISEQIAPLKRTESYSIPLIHSKTDGVYEKFKMLIASYLKACDEAQNLVNSEFYSMSDLPARLNYTTSAGNKR